MVKDTKVYKVLEQLDRVDLNRFQKFVRSPYFNANNTLYHLYDEMRAMLVGEISGDVDKQKMWRKIHSDKTYNDLKFRKLCSDLLRLVEQFLAQQVYEENPIYQASNLVEAVSRRKLEKLYSSVMKTARRLSDRQLEKSASYYFYQYQIEKFYYDISESEVKREQRLNIEDITQNIDKFFIAEKLRYYCTALSQKRVAEFNYEILFINEILSHVRSNPYIETPQITMYYLIYQLYTTDDGGDIYFKLKDEILKNIDSFPISEAHDILNSAINYCIGKINTGNLAYRYEIFELYQYSLKKDLIYINNEITPSTFRNIVVIALRLKEFKWAENFIEQYHTKLNKKYQENLYTFTLAQVNFYANRFNKVLELLREVEYEDRFINLQAKSILMATYYEIDEYEALDSLINSFKTYLTRHKESIPERIISDYRMLIRFIKKLISTPFTDREALQKLRKQVEAEPSIASKAWLLEKLKEAGA